MNDVTLCCNCVTISEAKVLNFVLGKFIHNVKHYTMKRIIFLISLAGVLLLLNACSTTGYVTTEPAYVEYTRPERPSNLHIWIDGDWQYNNQTHVYVQKNGYWSKPSQGRTYQSGHWQSNPKGKSWSKGHWKKNNR